jgi:hypothetical protein
MKHIANDNVTTKKAPVLRKALCFFVPLLVLCSWSSGAVARFSAVSPGNAAVTLQAGRGFRASEHVAEQSHTLVRSPYLAVLISNEDMEREEAEPDHQEQRHVLPREPRAAVAFYQAAGPWQQQGLLAAVAVAAAPGGAASALGPPDLDPGVARLEGAQGEEQGEESDDEPLGEHDVAHHPDAHAQEQARLEQQRDVVVDQPPATARADEVVENVGGRAAGHHEGRVGGGPLQAQPRDQVQSREEQRAAAHAAGARHGRGQEGEDPCGDGVRPGAKRRGAA